MSTLSPESSVENKCLISATCGRWRRISGELGSGRGHVVSEVSHYALKGTLWVALCQSWAQQVFGNAAARTAKATLGQAN